MIATLIILAVITYACTGAPVDHETRRRVRALKRERIAFNPALRSRR